jgi:hypothetical protein
MATSEVGASPRRALLSTLEAVETATPDAWAI